MKEEPVTFGAGQHLFAILTEPARPTGDENSRPVFVFLSAGLLHRVGPSRLHVRMARELAERGFSSVRVDLSGKGDSPSRPGMKNQESVAADFSDIVAGLRSRFNQPRIVLCGLCSGADNAIRLCMSEPAVIGMVLLDPICFPDRGFRLRSIARKYLDPRRYLRRLLRALGRRSRVALPGHKGDEVSVLSLRDLPSRSQVSDAFRLIRERRGFVLSVFTSYASVYYDKVGQLEEVTGVDDYAEFCTEHFWPQCEHTYKIESHRDMLVAEVQKWSAQFA